MHAGIANRLDELVDHMIRGGRSGLPIPRSMTSSPAARAASFIAFTSANTYGGSACIRSNSRGEGICFIGQSFRSGRPIFEPVRDCARGFAPRPIDDGRPCSTPWHRQPRNGSQFGYGAKVPADRPMSSGRPSITLAFCIACPAAPLSRLSRAQISTACPPRPSATPRCA